MHSLAAPPVCKGVPEKLQESRDLPAPTSRSRSSAFQQLPETFPKTVIQESVQERIQAGIGIA